MKKITTFLFLALLACNVFAGKPSLKDGVSGQSFDKTKAALDAGADPNEKWSGAPALYWAGILGQMDVIKLLIEKGAKVDGTGLLGLTPLSGVIDPPKSPEDLVAENKKTNDQILKHFTEEKAREKGWWKENDITKFSTASDRVKVLIEAGANPNFLLGNGAVKVGTPFLNAVEKQYLDIVKVMLDSKKVDPELRFDQWLESVSRIISKIEVGKYEKWDQKDVKFWASIPKYNTPLIFAIEKQNLELVKLLVEGGADINNGKKVSPYKEFTFAYLRPLDIAIDKGFKEIADYLLSKGAVRNQK